MNWGYVAGFFDGEGSVGVSRYKHKHRHPDGSVDYHWRENCFVCIFQSDPTPLHEIAEFLESQGIKAKVIPRPSYSEYDSTTASFKRVLHKVVRCYMLCVYSIEGKIRFLENIVSDLVVKRKAVEYALNWLLKRPSRHLGFRKIPIEIIKEWIELRTSGWSYKRIAQKYHTYPSTVQRCILKLQHNPSWYATLGYKLKEGYKKEGSEE